MGISDRDLDILILLSEGGYLGKHSLIIEIGAQQLSNAFLTAHEKLEKIAYLFDIPLPHPFTSSCPSYLAHGGLEHLSPDAPAARIFWQWLGLQYKSIDLDGSHDSLPLDLNYDPVPKKDQGKFQLVTNFGTTEHVANQLNAFKIIHDLTAIGGVMMHNLPTGGMLNHGLVNYNPKFFWMLARSNGYKWLYFDYAGNTTRYEFPNNIADHALQFNPTIEARKKDYSISDAGLVLALQKVYDTPYVPPLDVPTGMKINNKVLEKRYWSVFKKSPFR